MIARLGANRQWWIAAAVALAVGVFLAYWVRDLLNSPRYGAVTQTEELISRRADLPAPELTRGVTLSQTFVATDDDLTEVQVLMATFARQNTAEVVFKLQGDRVTRTVRSNSASMIDNQFHGFTFATVEDSGGKTFTATLSSPDGKPGDSVTAWLGNCDCYADGSPTISGEKREDLELAMRIEFAHEGVTIWRELLNRMSQYKPGIVQGAGLVVLGLLGTGLALVALAGVTLATMPKSDDEGRRPAWLYASIVVAVIVVLATGSLSRI
jgi:hypothetical protein